MSTAKPSIRLAARGIVMHNDRLLLVNAYKGRDDLWCAPGGGSQLHESLPDTLAREILEETGLPVWVGPPCLLNEFHDPNGTFHQVEVFFRCTVASSVLDPTWKDPEHIVTHRRWVSRAEMADLIVKPDSLAAVAWGDKDAPVYDALEAILP